MLVFLTISILVPVQIQPLVHRIQAPSHRQVCAIARGAINRCRIPRNKRRIRDPIISQIALVSRRRVLRRRALSRFRREDEPLLPVLLNVHPVIDRALVLVEVVADVLEARVPIGVVHALALRDEGVAEAAPELVVAFVAEVGLVDGVPVHELVVVVAVVAVAGVEVGGHVGLVVEESGAGGAVVVGDLTAPLFDEEVLGVLVPLPVVPAPKALETSRKCAAIGTAVSLLVLAAQQISLGTDGSAWCHDRTVDHRLVSPI